MISSHPENIKTEIIILDTFLVSLFPGQLLSLSVLVLHGERYHTINLSMMQIDILWTMQESATENTYLTTLFTIFKPKTEIFYM
jgi:hypothetical protein